MGCSGARCAGGAPIPNSLDQNRGGRDGQIRTGTDERVHDPSNLLFQRIGGSWRGDEGGDSGGIEAGDAGWAEGIQLRSGQAGELAGDGAAHGGGNREAVAGKARGERQTLHTGERADEGNVVEALGFQSAPGAGDVLLSNGGQERACGLPVAALAARTQGVATAIGGGVAEPAAAEQESAIVELLEGERAGDGAENGTQQSGRGGSGEEHLESARADGQAQAERNEQLVAPGARGQHNGVRVYVATVGTYACGARAGSKDGVAGDAGQVDIAGTLGGGGKGAGDAWGIGLSVGGAITAGGDALADARHERADLGGIHETHIVEAIVALALDERDQTLGLVVTFGQMEVAALTVAQIG